LNNNFRNKYVRGYELILEGLNSDTSNVTSIGVKKQLEGSELIDEFNVWWNSNRDAIKNKAYPDSQNTNLMWIIIVIIGLLFGLFAFSQIIYPLFSAWPRAKQLEREGKLKKSIPIATFIVAPIIWSVLLLGSIWVVNNYFSAYTKLYYIALVFILIVVIAQIPKQNRDLEADFKDSWKQYLKEE